jgi:predicted N-acetyltransferase YhbS
MREMPDAHWVLVRENGALLARCSLWWKKVPPFPDNNLGLIGHYAAVDSDSGRVLLRHACEQLASNGCTMAVGPMDGSTWRHYRFITERGPEPPFFLEIDHPDDWPRHFISEGFATLANYTSALNADLTRVDPRIPAIEERISRMEITIRPAQADKMDDELHRTHEVSLRSFQNNFLYTPLDENEFLAQYRKVLPNVRADLVLLAERNGELVGFVFALPDLLQAARGEPVDRFVMKTLAVIPECWSVGLGTLLMARSHETARDLGYKACVHAFMHESNRSQTMSNRSAKIIRRYTLFSKALVP